MAPVAITDAVFATLLINDGYLPGAMVLGYSLRDRKAKAKLVAFVVVETLTNTTITELKTVYDEVVPVQHLVNMTPANLWLMDRPDLISTFTKIQLWRQTQYKRIVYLDADMVALRAPNELLTLDTDFAAVPDIGWPDCFNSGLMVLNPNMADYYALLALAERGISFDGADQGLLNMHFTEWQRLSFTYNCTPSGNYQYVPAYRHFQSSISIVHFIGRDKPWTVGRQSSLNTGVYGELLARWWAVYDRHYRTQEIVYGDGLYHSSPKKVQDYVAGEETLYLPSYQRPPEPMPVHTSQVAQIHSTPAPPPATEQPMGDLPDVNEQIQQNDIIPVSTQEQRRWSAPHVDWEPARAPPPAHSKPEASNFPSTIYEMSDSRELFRPPASYPEAPKGMWYEVPAKPAFTSKPKPIFPWEAHAPKATRVFVEPKPPSPPPEPEVPSPEPVQTATPTPTAGETPVSPDTVVPTANDTTVEILPQPAPTTWETFSQRTNAWDDIPEIAAYMQAFHPPKRGRIQVLHHTPSTPTSAGDLQSPPLSGDRRDSVKITDFPTAVERPSLPVTPAPIRRPNFWGDDKEDEGVLPVAAGVPRQNEWVRQFSSYPTPDFAALPPIFQEVNGVLCMRCQHCGEQNPITRLEELKRRQSEIILGQQLEMAKDPPKRQMPDSQSKDDVIHATEKATSPQAGRTPLKPILKEPKFEVESTTSQQADASGGVRAVDAAVQPANSDDPSRFETSISPSDTSQIPSDSQNISQDSGWSTPSQSTSTNTSSASTLAQRFETQSLLTQSESDKTFDSALATNNVTSSSQVSGSSRESTQTAAGTVEGDVTDGFGEFE